MNIKIPINQGKFSVIFIALISFSFLNSCSVNNTTNDKKEEINQPGKNNGATLIITDTGTNRDTDGNTIGSGVNTEISAIQEMNTSAPSINQDNGEGKTESSQVESQNQSTTTEKENTLTMLIVDSEYKKVQQIQSLQELGVRYPSVQSMQGKENPKFFELAKKQLMLEFFIKGYDNQDFLILKEKLINLQMARAIWPAELIKIEKRNRLVGLDLKDDPSNIALTEEMQSIAASREKLFSELQSSKEFQDYQDAHKEEIEKTTKDMIEKLPPEIIQLQKDIATLRTEVYGTL